VTQQNEQMIGRRGDRDRPTFEAGGHRALPYSFRVPGVAIDAAGRQ
jgi:hypothetical protein